MTTTDGPTGRVLDPGNIQQVPRYPRIWKCKLSARSHSPC